MGYSNNSGMFATWLREFCVDTLSGVMQRRACRGITFF